MRSTMPTMPIANPKVMESCSPTIHINPRCITISRQTFPSEQQGRRSTRRSTRVSMQAQQALFLGRLLQHLSMAFRSQSCSHSSIRCSHGTWHTNIPQPASKSRLRLLDVAGNERVHRPNRMTVLVGETLDPIYQGIRSKYRQRLRKPRKFCSRHSPPSRCHRAMTMDRKPRWACSITTTTACRAIQPCPRITVVRIPAHHTMVRQASWAIPASRPQLQGQKDQRTNSHPRTIVYWLN